MLLLSLKDNQGHLRGRELYRAVSGELAERVVGLTAHTRAPAGGPWREDSSGAGWDEIVIYEVRAEDLDEGCWREYRLGLETAFAGRRWLCRRRRAGSSERIREGRRWLPPG